ncbi:MAG: RHS repeat-associated core domain-containing protein [Planctomycetota bacterium]|nr:RHS repeat-associated core domain-containing protein [Planctomycetota bacterium]
MGNLTDDARDYTYTYDAFGRLVAVRNRSNSALVAEYRYNGLGFRTGWHYDADADGTVESGSPGDDPWYWFCNDERWRIVATFRHTDSYPKERFVFHAAGADGLGGSSYIDAVVLRDRDINSGWRVAGDGTLEERFYYCQNWRADVSLVLAASGASGGGVKERVKYSAYGVAQCITPADYNANGQVDLFDYNDFMDDYGSSRIRSDVNFDGQVDFDDYLDFIAAWDGGAGEEGGLPGSGQLSRASIASRIGYAGYEFDLSIAGSGTGGGAGKYHVRHRVYDAAMGRWTRRDPLGYVDGASVYEYVKAMAVVGRDMNGLDSVIGVGSGGVRLLSGPMAPSGPAIPGDQVPPGYTPYPCILMYPGADTTCQAECSLRGKDFAESRCFISPDGTNGRLVCVCVTREPACSPERYAELKWEFEVWNCHGVPTCNRTTPCDQVPAFISHIAHCIDIRTRINQECFEGGNYGHRQAVKQLISQLEKCAERLRQCNAKDAEQ